MPVPQTRILQARSRCYVGGRLLQRAVTVIVRGGADQQRHGPVPLTPGLRHAREPDPGVPVVDRSPGHDDPIPVRLHRSLGQLRPGQPEAGIHRRLPLQPDDDHLVGRADEDVPDGLDPGGPLGPGDPGPEVQGPTIARGGRRR